MGKKSYNTYHIKVPFETLRNTLCFFIALKSAISPGSNRDCSTVSAMYPALPCWKSCIEAFNGRGAPFRTNGRVQAWTLGERSRPLSIMDPLLEDLVWPVLATPSVAQHLWLEDPSPPPRLPCP